MTAVEFRELVKSTGLHQKKLATLIGRHQVTLIKYLSGAIPIPKDIAEKVVALDTLINGRLPPDADAAVYVRTYVNATK